MEKNGGILVIGEYFRDELRNVSYELVAKARELADKINSPVSFFVLGYNMKNLDSVSEYGADFIYIVDDVILKDFDDKIYGDITSDFIIKTKPHTVLAPATSMGRSFIPRVATHLETGLTADCIDLDIDVTSGNLIQKRPAWGGNMIANIICPCKRPQMATVRPGVFKANKIGEKGARIEKIDISQFSVEKSIFVLKSERDDYENSLLNCDVVFSVGRGVRRELIPLLQEISRNFGWGVGCTRPVSDENILSHSSQIGQSGIFINSKVCISLGISGAIQYTVGIKGVDMNVAVNSDKEAQIFDVVDYAIVADANEFITVLYEKIKEIKGIK